MEIWQIFETLKPRNSDTKKPGNLKTKKPNTKKPRKQTTKETRNQGSPLPLNTPTPAPDHPFGSKCQFLPTIRKTGRSQKLDSNILIHNRLVNEMPSPHTILIFGSPIKGWWVQ